MKKMWMWTLALMLGSTMTFTGCGGEGGSVGDENDPAAEADEEQMQDESGDM